MKNEVLVEVNDGVMVVTINRSEVKNAVNLAVSDGIAEAMERLDRDDAIRVAVLTGKGNVFCAGMDLKGFSEGKKPFHFERGFAGLVERPPKKPLIAAIEGFALAGGLELALSCDLIVAARDVRFGLPEVKRGLIAAAGGLLRLPRQIPSRVAMEMALTGEFYSAQYLYDLGLVNRLVEPGEALSEAQKLAGIIAGNAPLSVTESKRMIIESADWSGEEMFARQKPIMDAIFASSDAKEGASAFVEKRKPVWSGK